MTFFEYQNKMVHFLVFFMLNPVFKLLYHNFKNLQLKLQKKGYFHKFCYNYDMKLYHNYDIS